MTRYAPHDNSRYVLPFLCCFILLGAVSTIRAFTRRSPRIVLAVLAAGVSIAGAYRTIDPVSERLFATFGFGEHRMLNMTGIARGCCGYGRDQLVYNLQFVNFHYLHNPLYQATRPDSETIFIQAWDTHWAIRMPLTEDGYERTMRRTGTFEPRYTYLAEFEEEFPGAEEAYYIAYPNADNSRQLK